MLEIASSLRLFGGLRHNHILSPLFLPDQHILIDLILQTNGAQSETRGVVVLEKGRL